MNLEWYYTFLKVAKYENYRKAASEIFTTQTTVFNHIKNLENFLNIKLFEQNGRNIILSNDGKAFYPIAVETISTYEKGINRIKNVNKYDCTLNIVVNTYVDTYIIPKFLPFFFAAAPHINVSFSVADQSMASDIREGRFDLGITRDLNGLKDLSHKNICEGQVKLFVPNTPENGNIHDEIEYLKKYRVFCNNHPTYWEKLKEDIYNIVPQVDFCSISSVSATENLIKSNQGISYLPTYIFRDGHNDSVKFINSEQIEAPYSITYVVWKSENKEIQLFIDLFSMFITNELTNSGSTDNCEQRAFTI